MENNGRAIKLNGQQLARGLGWFSLGLGAMEVLAPRQVAKFLGVGRHYALVRVLGLREIASGIGILTQQRTAGWVWSRVGGDVMDLALLGAAARGDGSNQSRVAAVSAAVAGVTALDVFCGRELSHRSPSGKGAVHLEESIIINRPPEEIYRFWLRFEELPLFMDHLVSVKVTGSKRSHWVAKGPAGTIVEWDAEIINETPNELIAWRSLESADVDHAGTVRFERAPGGRGTLLKVKMQYRPPAGVVGGAFAKLFGQAPEKQVPIDLLRLKQFIETGEIARTEGQPTGPAKTLSRKYDAVVQS